MHIDLWEDENNPKNIGCIWNLQQSLLEHAYQVFWIIDISTICATESIFSNMLFKDYVYVHFWGSGRRAGWKGKEHAFYWEMSLLNVSVHFTF